MKIVVYYTVNLIIYEGSGLYFIIYEGSGLYLIINEGSGLYPISHEGSGLYYTVYLSLLSFFLLMVLPAADVVMYTVGYMVCVCVSCDFTASNSFFFRSFFFFPFLAVLPSDIILILTLPFVFNLGGQQEKKI